MLKNIFKRVSSTAVALTLGFTTFASSITLTASAKADTINPSASVSGEFASANEIIAQASQLLGARYILGRKGFNNVYESNSGAYTPSQINGKEKTNPLPTVNRGIDCSGLPYWTLRTLGYYSKGFSNSNQLPYDSYEWTGETNTDKMIGKKDTDNVAKGKVTVNGKTTEGYVGVNHKSAKLEKVEWQKKSTIKSSQPKTIADWWLLPNGDTIAPGSLVIADDGDGKTSDATKEHCWIYIGYFTSKEAVAEYIAGLLKGTANPLTKSQLLNTKSGGNYNAKTGKYTPSTHMLIEDWTAKNKELQGLKASDPKKYYHWRIESNGSDGVVINNGLTAKDNAILKVSTVPLAPNYGSVEIEKYIDPAGNRAKVLASSKNYSKWDKIHFVLQAKSLTSYPSANGKYVVAEKKSAGNYNSKDAKTFYQKVQSNGSHMYLDSNAKLKIDNLPTGTYTLIETTDTESLGLRKPVNRTITVTANSTTTAAPIEITNEEQSGTLKVVKKTQTVKGKTDAKTNPNVIKNARFKLYDKTESKYVRAAQTASGKYTYIASDSTSGTELALNSSDGTLIVNELPKKHSYTLKETKTDSSFIIASGNTNVAVAFTADKQTVTKNLTNTTKYGTLNIVKKDSNAKVVANVSFVVTANKAIEYKGTNYAANKTIATLKTNSSGKASITDLPVITANNEAITYTVKETGAYRPYRVVNTTQSVTFNGSDVNHTTQYISKTVNFTNTPLPAQLVINKLDGETKAKITSPAEFDIIASEDFTVNGTKLLTKNQKVAHVTTTNGTVTVTNNIYADAKYRVVETKAPSGYMLDKTAKNVNISWKNTVNLNYVSTTLNVNNTFQTVYARINKVDSETNKAVKAIQGAEFTLYAAEDIKKADGTTRWKKNAAIGYGTSDTNGLVKFFTMKGGTTEVKLPVKANYYVKETKVPKNYNNNSSWEWRFNAPYSATAANNRVISKTVSNKWQIVYARVTKIDSVSKKSLQGAEFVLYTGEKVTKADGTTRWNANTAIGYGTSDKNGLVKFFTTKNGTTERRIPVGFQYYVKETKPPVNYVKNSKWEWRFNAPYDASKGDGKVVSKQVTNEEQDGNIKIFKYKIVKGEKTDTKVYINGAKFTLYCKDTITLKSGKTVKAGTAIQTVTTATVNGQKGFAQFDPVPVGHQYTVKETYTPAGLVNANTTKTFALKYNVELEYVETELSIENKETELWVSKLRLNDKKTAVVGAKLQILDSNKKAVFSWTSDGKDHLVKGIKAGTYTLHETYAPKGYVIAVDIKFTIDDKNNVKVNGTTVSSKNGTPIIAMYDDYTVIEVSKVDVTSNKELKGAKLRVVDKNGTVIDSWTSDGNTHKIVGKLAVGETYKLQETYAPEGYLIAKEVSFKVTGATNNGKAIVQKVTMKDDYTHTEISKVDITGKDLIGAKLKVVNSAGKTIAEWTSNGQSYKLYRLPVGTYTLTETAAPSGHLIAEKVTFKVTAEKDANGKPVITRVKMIDDYTKLAILKIDKKTGKALSGAVLQLIDSKGKVYKQWTTTTSAQRIDKIPVGTYTLHEVSAPAGYVRFKDQKVVISASDFKKKDYVKSITVADDITTAEIDKTSITDGKKIIGAKLTIKDSKGKVIAQWTTTQEAHKIERISVGTYTLTETFAPAGYVIANTVTFTITETAAIQKVHMVDDVTKLEISKYKANAKTDDDKPLAGAVLKLTDKETGKIVDQWTTNGTPHKIYEKLTAGKTYVLEEISAPAGYVVCKDKKEITISVDGKIDRLSLTDDTTKVELSKKKITGDDELKGAKLQIIDTTTNKVVEEWTSTTKPHYLEAKLIAGRKYILREIAAPDEYALTSDVTFTVSTDGSIDKVDIRDTNLAELPTAGGVGTGIFCIFGIFMMLAAIMLKKRED